MNLMGARQDGHHSAIVCLHGSVSESASDMDLVYLILQRYSVIIDAQGTPLILICPRRVTGERILHQHLHERGGNSNIAYPAKVISLLVHVIILLVVVDIPFDNVEVVTLAKRLLNIALGLLSLIQLDVRIHGVIVFLFALKHSTPSPEVIACGARAITLSMNNEASSSYYGAEYSAHVILAC